MVGCVALACVVSAWSPLDKKYASRCISLCMEGSMHVCGFCILCEANAFPCFVLAAKEKRSSTKQNKTGPYVCIYVYIYMCTGIVYICVCIHTYVYVSFLSAGRMATA